jgi:predicted porin
MVTAATVAIMATAVSAALIYGITKVGAETSLAAEAIPNLPLTTDYGASKSNRE